MRIRIQGTVNECRSEAETLLLSMMQWLRKEKKVLTAFFLFSFFHQWAPSGTDSWVWNIFCTFHANFQRNLHCLLTSIDSNLIGYCTMNTHNSRFPGFGSRHKIKVWQLRSKFNCLWNEQKNHCLITFFTCFKEFFPLLRHILSQLIFWIIYPVCWRQFYKNVT